MCLRCRRMHKMRFIEFTLIINNKCSCKVWTLTPAKQLLFSKSRNYTAADEAAYTQIDGCDFSETKNWPSVRGDWTKYRAAGAVASISGGYKYIVTLLEDEVGVEQLQAALTLIDWNVLQVRDTCTKCVTRFILNSNCNAAGVLRPNAMMMARAPAKLPSCLQIKESLVVPMKPSPIPE
jgi:hypothetical protein